MKWQIQQPGIPADSAELIDWLLINRDITNATDFLGPINPIKLSPTDAGIDQANLDIALASFLKNASVSE